MDFYTTIAHLVTFDFSTNLILKGWIFTFSNDDVINSLSLIDVEEPTFPIISVEFKNFVALYLRFEFSLVIDQNFTKMENKLV